MAAQLEPSQTPKRTKTKKSPMHYAANLPRYVGQLVILGWVAFTIIIIGWIFIASVSTTKEIFTNNLLDSGLHFENYAKVFKQHNIGKYFLNSAIYTAGGCIGALVLAAPAAYALSNFTFKGKRIIETAYQTTMGIPSIMLMVPLFMLITSFNLSGSTFTLIFLYICISIPFTMFYLTGFFSTLPHDLLEAALIDGCSHIKSFWRIILPLAKPGIATVTIFNFIGLWNEYMWALIFANTSDKRSLALGLQSIVEGMTYSGDWAGLFAAVVIVIVPTIIVYAFLSEKIMGSTTEGAVKG